MNLTPDLLHNLLLIRSQPHKPQNETEAQLFADLGAHQLVALTPDGFVLSERGALWLEMIFGTPLPVQQWTDPRTGRPYIPPAEQGRRLPDPAPLVFRAPQIVQQMVAHPGSADVSMPVAYADVPEGFTPWAGIKRPETVAHNDFVEVYRRNGERARMYAASINWKVTDRADDVVGFMVIPEPEAANKAHIGNSAKAKGAKQ